MSAASEAVADIRRRVAMLAKTMPFSEQQIEDIKLAIGEAASNAMKHGSPKGEHSMVKVQCERREDSFVVQIMDEGSGFDPEAQLCKHPDKLDECGRGLLFMRLLMDEVSFTFDRGTTVRMVKRLNQSAPER